MSAYESEGGAHDFWNDETREKTMSAPTGITCPKCLRTSYNPNDVAHGYCGYCHDWTGEALIVDVPLPIEPCPECHVGKHGNCDTTAWDYTLDTPCPCPCFVNGHTQ